MYLLDTHTLLWFLHGSPNIPQKVLNIIKADVDSLIDREKQCNV